MGVKKPLTALFIFVLLSTTALSLIPLATATTNTFGYNTVGGSTVDLNEVIKASTYTMNDESGTADSVSVYLTGFTAGKKVKVALYDSGDNLLATSDELTGDGGTGWKTFNIATAPELTALATYTIAIMGDATGGYGMLNKDTGGNNKYYWKATTYGAFPNPFNGDTGTGTDVISAYVTYTVGGAGGDPELNINTSNQVYTGGNYSKVTISGVTNVTLNGLRIGVLGLTATNMNNSIIQNCTFPSNGTAGGWLTVETNSNNNQILNNTLTDGDIWYDSDNALIENNTLNGDYTRGEIWTYTNSQNVTINRNRIYPYINFSAVGGNYGIDIIVSNNTIIGKGGAASDAINMASMYNVQIYGNSITNGTKNIVNVDLAYNGTIHHNNITNVGENFAGIKLFPNDGLPLNVSIYNNNINGGAIATNAGIALDNANYTAIYNNTISNVATGIGLYAATTYANATFNTFSNVTTAIALDGAVTYTRILNNTVSGDATNGAFVKNTANFNEIAFNNFTGATNKADTTWGVFDNNTYWHDNLPDSGEPNGTNPFPSPSPTPSTSTGIGTTTVYATTITTVLGSVIGISIYIRRRKGIGRN